VIRQAGHRAARGRLAGTLCSSLVIQPTSRRAVAIDPAALAAAA
jgi:hypothetical protein